MTRMLGVIVLVLMALPSVVWAQVLRGPRAPTPADVFRHQCNRGYHYVIRYRRCLPKWEDRRRHPGGR